MQKNKIMITGGHAGTTALALIEEIKRRKAFSDIVWVGNKRALENVDIETLESKLFSDLKIKHHYLDSGRIQRRWSKKTLLALVKIPFSFIKCFLIVSRERPAVTVAFGGAVSTPIVFSSWILGIPAVVHEQTVAIGLANKINSYFSQKIAIARLESKKYFSAKSRIVHVGNPINSALRSVKRNKLVSRKGRRTIYITGGSRGSLTINKSVFAALKHLKNKYYIIHQTGELDYKKAQKYKSKHYQPRPYFSPEELCSIYSKVDIVVTRAGANTIAELIALSIPSIVIPIPWTSHDEQGKNAQLAKKVGIAEVVKEQDLSAKVLLEKLKLIEKNYKRYSKSKPLPTVSLDKKAHKLLLEVVSSVIK